MAGRVLLDTNIVIELLRPLEATQAFLRAAQEVFVPSIVIGELYFGAFKSGRPEANTGRIADFAAENAILLPDARTGREYGRIKKMLKDKGRPIPENDIWIAAVALQHGLELITRDAHFHEVPELVVNAPG